MVEDLNLVVETTLLKEIKAIIKTSFFKVYLKLNLILYLENNNKNKNMKITKK